VRVSLRLRLHCRRESPSNGLEPTRPAARACRELLDRVLRSPRAPEPEAVNKGVITALVIAFVLGGLELRGHVVSLEVQVADVSRRVDRIERLLDAKEYADARP